MLVIFASLLESSDAKLDQHCRSCMDWRASTVTIECCEADGSCKTDGKKCYARREYWGFIPELTPPLPTGEKR
jgi:hypothetical protein